MANMWMRALTTQHRMNPIPACGCEMVEMTTIEVTVISAMGIRRKGTLRIVRLGSEASVPGDGLNRRYSNPTRVSKTTAYSMIPKSRQRERPRAQI